MKIVYNTKDIVTPKHGLVVYKDSYWLCENGDPKKALFFGRSPQCNTNKRTLELTMARGIEPPPNTQIVFIETAFIPSFE